jgi:hypothetical protein
MKAATAVVSGMILLSVSARAQTPFQNLDFESAQVPDVLDFSHIFAPFSQALPGWVGYFGTNPVSQAVVNTVSLGTYNISILGHNTSPGLTLLDGNWSAVIQAGSVPPAPPLSATLAQTGFIPAGTLSLQMRVGEIGQTDINDMVVTLGGQAITMRHLPSGFYAGDISQFAGQTAELRITVLPAPLQSNSSLELDDIVFSPQPVPEPTTITALALMALIARMGHERMRPTDQRPLKRLRLASALEKSLSDGFCGQSAALNQHDTVVMVEEAEF